MTSELWVTLILGILGCSGLWKGIECATKAIYNKLSKHRHSDCPAAQLGDKIDTISQKMDEVVELQKSDHRAIIRLQLLQLIKDRPENEAEILNLAEEYFDRLGGNRWAVGLFREWWQKYHGRNNLGEYDYPKYFVTAYYEHYHRNVFDDDKKDLKTKKS